MSVIQDATINESDFNVVTRTQLTSLAETRLETKKPNKKRKLDKVDHNQNALTDNHKDKIKQKKSKSKSKCKAEVIKTRVKVENKFEDNTEDKSKDKSDDNDNNADNDNTATDSVETKKNSRKKPKQIKTPEELTIRELCLFNNLRRTLDQNPGLGEKIYDIIVNRFPSSNRIFEHFYTGYSRKYNVILDQDGQESPTGEFIVADEYYKYLPKTDTDPCRRGSLIRHTIETGQVLETTISQLGSNVNICTSPIYNYVKDNAEKIRTDLDKEKGILKKKKQDAELPEVKRVEISQYLPGPVVLSF